MVPIAPYPQHFKTQVLKNHYSHPSRCKVVSYCGLICCCLMTTDAEHLFMCLLVMCLSSSDKCPFKSLFCWFLNCVACLFAGEFFFFFFYCWWVLRVHYIFWILSPYQINDLQVSFLFYSHLFNFLVLSFDEQQFLILMKPNLFFLSLLVTSVSHLRIHCYLMTLT